MIGLNQNFSPGDWVVFRKQKRSDRPGPRAQIKVASPKGESYVYVVDKYWVVDNVKSDGTLELVTRRGKRHVIPASDRRIRKANLWERFRFGSRFRAVEQAGTSHDQQD